MSLSTIATGHLAPAVKAGFNTANKLKNGASVADIKNEAKEKIGNDVDTFKKVTKTTAATAVAGGATILAAQTGVAGKIAKLIPDSVKTNAADGLKKLAGNGVVQKLAGFAKTAASKTIVFAKAHPVATAALAAIGFIGTAAIENIKENGAKNEGKIEQKYADILDLKNAAAKDLG